MPSNLAVSLPSAPTTKTYGSVGSPQSSTAWIGIGLLSAESTVWRWPSVIVSWYGSTWMKVSRPL
jgi:hypothetical protein